MISRRWYGCGAVPSRGYCLSIILMINLSASFTETCGGLLCRQYLLQVYIPLLRRLHVSPYFIQMLFDYSNGVKAKRHPKTSTRVQSDIVDLPRGFIRICAILSCLSTRHICPHSRRPKIRIDVRRCGGRTCKFSCVSIMRVLKLPSSIIVSLMFHDGWSSSASACVIPSNANLLFARQSAFSHWDIVLPTRRCSIRRREWRARPPDWTPWSSRPPRGLFSSRNTRIASRVTFVAPQKFTSNMRRASLSGVPSTSATDEQPALLNTTSTRPNFASAAPEGSRDVVQGYNVEFDDKKLVCGVFEGEVRKRAGFS